MISHCKHLEQFTAVHAAKSRYRIVAISEWIVGDSYKSPGLWSISNDKP
jgi:hypothetical protein